MPEQPPPPEIVAALRRIGLLAPWAPSPLGRPLTGGVSSDIWLVSLPSGAICVKRALAQLAECRTGTPPPVSVPAQQAVHLQPHR